MEKTTGEQSNDDKSEDTSSIRESQGKRKKPKRKDSPPPKEDSPGENDDRRKSIVKIAPSILTTCQIGKLYLDREAYLKVNIREMLIFFVFLIILGLVTSGQHGPEEYFLTQTMTKLFVEKQFRAPYTNEKISFMEIATIEHIWAYLDPFLENTFWIYWYDHHQRVDLAEPGISDAIFHENKLLGSPRVRLVKVKNDSCSIPDEVNGLFKNCYAEYSSSAEYTDDLIPAATNVSDAFKYQSASDLGSLPVRGEISTYGGGGYCFDFNISIDNTNASLRDLESQTWIDRNTRAVIIQFSTYSLNEHLFFTLTLLFEIPPTGGVIPSYIIHVHKLMDKYTWDFLLVLLFAAFVLYLFWYTLEELYEITYFKSHYFDYFWNFLDLLILILSYITIVLAFHQILVIQTQVNEFVFIKEGFACLDQINSSRETYITLLVTLFFFASIKAVKYLNFNLPMHQMRTTLNRASNDIACFSIIFFIVFLSFSQLGHLLFGTQVRDFKTILDSAYTLLRTAIGDFEYLNIEITSHNFLGPIYFFVYIFFIYFILVNIFLAIIIDAYSNVRTNLRDHKRDLYISDIFGGYFRKMLRFCGMNKFADKYEPPPTKISGGTSTYDDIQNQLRRCGFTETEIDSFFAKFDIPKEKSTSKDEIRQKILQKLYQQETDLLEKEKEKDVLGESLVKRIKDLEENVIDVNSKIDLIDQKIDNIQKIRARRSDTK